MDDGDWTRELVRMNAAYGGDSLLVYLYLPKRGVAVIRRWCIFRRGRRCAASPPEPGGDAVN